MACGDEIGVGGKVSVPVPPCRQHQMVPQEQHMDRLFLLAVVECKVAAPGIQA